MSLAKRTLFIVLTLALAVGNNLAHAQPWRYLNDSPAKQKTFERSLKKEASSIVTRQTIADGEKFPYDIMTYTILSFDDKPANISLWEKPFNGHIFHIDLPNDKLIIPDFSGLLKVHHLSNDILEIVYSPRGGSDQGYDNVLLLGVNKGKFCVLMDILCVNEYQAPGEYGLYKLDLKLSGKNVNNYRLNAQIRDLVKSTDREKRLDKNSSYTLKFDKIQHLVYNEIKTMDTKVEIAIVNTGNTRTAYLKGAYPMINVGKYQYLSVNGLWYAINKNIIPGKTFLSPATTRPGS